MQISDRSQRKAGVYGTTSGGGEFGDGIAFEITG
jgi:hypothetical protein